MARSETASIRILIWSLFLQTIFALALPKAPDNKKFNGTPVAARSLYEQYSLGQQEEGAKIIYTYQYTQFFNESQQEISLDFHYPVVGEPDEDEATFDSPVKITHIELFVKSQDGSDTQAFVTEGGIGENNISLQIIATNTELLNYMLVIYGKAD